MTEELRAAMREHIETLTDPAATVFGVKAYDGLKRRGLVTVERFEQVATTYKEIQAEVIAERRQKEIADRRAKLKAEMATALATQRAELKEADHSIVIPAETLDRLEELFRDVVPAEHLDGLNADLRERNSGPISYRDMAVVAFVHRDSVMFNGTRRKPNEAYRGTSPYKRFREVAAEIKLRPAAFDNRQIQTILDTLQRMGFTAKVAEAIHDTANPRNSRAAVWTISEDPLWVDLFGA